MSQQTNYSYRPWLDGDAEPFIKIRNVTKKFGEFTAVDNIDLDIYKGELFLTRWIWLWKNNLIAHAGRI